MTSELKAATNRSNSLKSTGPKTAEGRAKSAQNARKHGLRSARAELMRERSLEFEQRRMKWMANGDARDDVEEFLASHLAATDYEVVRVIRANAEECRSQVKKADVERGQERSRSGEPAVF